MWIDFLLKEGGKNADNLNRDKNFSLKESKNE